MQLKIVPRTLLSASALFLAIFAGACGDAGGELGEACYEDLDCAEALICDLHGQEVGTCQEPHEH